jgi:AcrR family transcriptional regulator
MFVVAREDEPMPPKSTSSRRSRVSATAERAPRGTGQRNRRGDLVENELYERAAELFAERGFAGTTLQDIADAMGTSRSALYHYVKNKDDLLAKLVAEVSQELGAALRAIRRQPDLPADEQVRQMAQTMVSWMVSRSVRFRLLILSEQDLPPDLARTHRNAKRTIRDELAAAVAEGVRSGVFRPVDEQVAAYAVVGMCNWTAWWFQPGPDHPADPVVTQIADMALHSLRWPDEKRHRAEGPAGALTRLEEELRSLKQMLQG